jgi:MFS transporter, DHA1 family, multidrug resistance protein
VRSSTTWHRAAVLFALASFVETLGFGHLGAFTPIYLEQLGLPQELVPQWTGLLAGATWLLGLPLAPLWGVWADRYSRKLIIVRSTLVEGLIFFLFAIAGAPWQLYLARLLVGFILGNTGVMYAMLADLAPRAQVATAIGFITIGSTVGASIGPFFGGWLVTQVGVSGLYLLDAGVAWAVTLVLIMMLKDERSAPRPDRSSLELLRALPASLTASPAILPLFGLYAVSFLGTQMQAPFVPLLIAEIYQGADLPVVIGAVLLASGAASAIATPFVTRLGGRYGEGRVLVICLAAGALIALAQAVTLGIVDLVASRALLGLLLGATSPLIISMIALSTPEDRRATVLNVTMFPSYAGFIVGAAAGTALAAISIRAVFVGSAAVLATAAALTTPITRRVEPRATTVAS